MSWLQSLDVALFRFINLQLRNPLFDASMPQLSGNGWFFPAVFGLTAALLWKGGLRARLMVLMLGLLIVLGDSFVINTLKQALERPRPFHEVPEAVLLVGRGGSGSMPSSHSASWWAATVIAFVYFPWSWRFMVPFALLMCFSRVYLGAHYPSDVVVGALLGAGYGFAGLFVLNEAWRTLGRRWFPLWWSRIPSLIPARANGSSWHEVHAADRGGHLVPSSETNEVSAHSVLADLQWMRLGYLVIAVLLLARLSYIGSGKIQLSEDEAYQWLWSKHLALSYFSKPPMIALLQFAGTSLWGDTVFGIRFFSPVISAVLSTLLLRFFAREANPRLAFLIVLIASCTPLLSAGSILMTIDPPLVLFWTAAMFAGWRAVQANGTTRDWSWTGLWGGLGFLSKYSAMFLIGCFAFYFLLAPAARRHLRTPGPWIALGIFSLCTLPVIIWNAQNGWITARHVADNAKLDEPWQVSWKLLSNFLEFSGQEFGLLNPVFFVAMLIAAVRFWRLKDPPPLLRYLFAMGAPVFAGFWLYTFHSRVQANWIAPAVVPLLALMALYWEQRWKAGSRRVQAWAVAGLVFGSVAVILFHDTDLAQRLVRTRLPVKADPLRRVRAIDSIADAVADARNALETEGSRTFIIASHYGLTSQITFYRPEARAGLPRQPLVYPRQASQPKNQFYFWPEYRYRQRQKGENAIYVKFDDGRERLPPDLVADFESVTDLGPREIRYGRRAFHRIRLFACRGLR